MTDCYVRATFVAVAVGGHRAGDKRLRVDVFGIFDESIKCLRDRKPK